MSSEKLITDAAGSCNGKLLILRRNSHILTLLMGGNRLLTASACKESADSLMGNIYIGKVQNIAANIEAAFVEITEDILCFLPLCDARTPFVTNRTYDGHLKAGDELLVQVNRAALKTKLPSVTTKLSLTGKHCVLVSGSSRLGMSEKLSSDKRSGILSFLQSQGLVDGSAVRQTSSALPNGFIVRTNTGTLEELSPLLEEWIFLEEEYQSLLSVAAFRTCHTCLKQSPAPWLAGLAGFYSHEYTEIVTDCEDIYKQLTEYLASSPAAVSVPIRLYADTMLSLSKLYSVESHLETALNSRVWLKSGGYLIIEPTEALTVIDVNTGKYDARRGNAEDTFHKINLEAAQEIALQLRLRNLSGIIIIDFINVNSSHKKELLSSLQHMVKKDSVRTDVIDITPLGLVEVTRKKINKPLSEQLK